MTLTAGATPYDARSRNERTRAVTLLSTTAYPVRVDGSLDGVLTLPSAPTPRWSTGRVITSVLGTLVALMSAVGLAVGGVMLWLDRTQRDSAGFVTSDRESVQTAAYALVSESMSIEAGPASRDA
jgi:hypothetical protein